MRLLFWDTFAGISGDMALGSLISAGADPEVIETSIKSIGLDNFSLEVSSKTINGISAIDIDVRYEETKHHHRHLKDIEQMIISGNFSSKAKEHALSVFSILGLAEAKVHGTTMEKVHFHEVGAVDSIVDIVGTCIALDLLDISQVFISKLPWSSGFVHCQHGILPVPAPATVEILAGYQFYDSGIVGELITPTGAALIKALGTQSSFPSMTILQTGYGSGKKNYGIPNLLRAVIGKENF